MRLLVVWLGLVGWARAGTLRTKLVSGSQTSDQDDERTAVTSLARGIGGNNVGYYDAAETSEYIGGQANSLAANEFEVNGLALNPGNLKTGRAETEIPKKKKKKKKRRRRKFKSSQSVRVLVPGNKGAPADQGPYSRREETHGQSLRKRKSESSLDSVSARYGSREDTVSRSRSRESSLDADQKARIASDSTGMTEIVLSQEMQSRRKEQESVGRSSGPALGGAVGKSAYSERAASSETELGRYSRVEEESYT